MAVPVGGSFRDPAGRVYQDGQRILRGVDAATLQNFDAIKDLPFFVDAVAAHKIVHTTVCPPSDPAARALIDSGWAGVLEHERLEIITYPYEWPFSMLKDAALLTLDLLADAIANGFILKDATPYNVQFVGTRPVFIDVPSFIPRRAGEHWRAYRQFCMLFLYPLMLKAYSGVNFSGFLRANLDGIPPDEMSRLLRGFSRFKRGVPSHVLFPAMAEQSVAVRDRDDAPTRSLREFKQSDTVVKALVDSMRRLVRGLASPVRHTEWSHYAEHNTYPAEEQERKRAFVSQVAAQVQANITWDLGGNTGTFSHICAEHGKFVLAVDSDHDAVERLYLEERAAGGAAVLPLTANLANLSPNHGWAGAERLAFDARNRPQLVLCLALVHHIALSANIPLDLFVGWLRTLDAELVIEFVDRSDEMVQKLLANKTEQYPDYNLEAFERVLNRHYQIVASVDLKGGRRRLYHCRP